MFDYYRSADGRAFLRRQTLLLLAAALALWVVLGDGRLDFAVARRLFDDASQSFPLANHWLLKGVLHDAVRTATVGAALVLAALTATSWAVPRAGRLHPHRRELLFVMAGALVAAAVVGALKHFSVHACPWDLESFGGAAAYHPLLQRGAVSAVHGCFPAAHPLVGYAWLAAGFSLYPLARRLAYRAWIAAGTLGTLFGAVQIVRGAHFLSHVLWSAWVVWAVNVALLAICVWRPRRLRSEPGRPANVLDVLVVLVADVFHELPAGPQRVRELHGERLRVSAGIVNRGHGLELADLRARVALDRAQLRRVRMAHEIEPEEIVEADGFDDERVTFPVPDRVAVPSRLEVVGMRAAVHEDLAKAMDVAFVQEE